MGDPALIAEFLLRSLGTASIVLVVVLAAGRFGPIVAGALAGLPMILAPGHAFLLWESGPDFVERAATASLASLAGTQIAIGAFALLARRGLVVPLLGATLGWALAAGVSAAFPPAPLPAAGLFLTALVGARTLSGRARLGQVMPVAVSGLGSVIVRALVAGLLVAVATLVARLAGPFVGGILLAFPIGILMITASLQARYGAPAAIETAHAATLGVGSLATFTFALTQTLPRLAPAAAFATSLGAAVLVTLAVAAPALRRPAR